MTCPDISVELDSLYSLHRNGIKLGLDHTFQLLEFLGNPHKKLNLIHVAGTNGKGSTCAHVECILRGNGYKVGLYTSPHLINFNERIRVNGFPIKNDEIISYIKSMDTAIQKIDSTFFEVTTAMALKYFNDHNVDVAIIETGLGGRLDSTNVIEPSMTIMTPISMDHMDILGDSIQQIAKEKSGIIKDDIILITAKQDRIVMDILYDKAKEKKSSIIIAKDPLNVSFDYNGTSFRLDNKNYKTPLIGDFQAANASLAISAIRNFDKKITHKAICKSLRDLCWPGRLQSLSKQIYYDVAHNESGIKATLRSFNMIYPGYNIYGLFCLKGDKDLNLIAFQLKDKLKKLFIADSKSGLLLNAENLSTKLNNLGIENSPVKSIKDGIKALRAVIKEKDIGLIFGTHYIAEDIFKEFEISFDSGVI